MARKQLIAQRFAVPDGNVDGLCGLIDQMKTLCHGFKGEAAAGNTAAKMLYDACFVQVAADQRAVSGEITLDAFRCAGVLATGQCLDSRADIDAKQSGSRDFAGKDSDEAVIGAVLSVPVAAARRLQYGVQTGHFPVYCREIDVHARFNQGGGNHPAGQTRLQTLPHGLQHCLTVGRAHQRGKMEVSLARKLPVDLLRGLSGVDDAQHLRMGRQRIGQGCVGERPRVLKGDPAELFMQLGDVGTYFPDDGSRRKGLDQVVQRGLRGSAENGSRTKVGGQFGDHTDAGR